MELIRIEYRILMALACFVRKAIDELIGQLPRLQIITLRRGTFDGTTVVRVTTTRAIVNALDEDARPDRGDE